MNEIITYGKGYDLSNGIKTFIKSSKPFCDKLTVICSDLSSSLLRFLEEQNVNVVSSVDIASRFNVDETISPYTLKVIYFYLYAKHLCTSTNVYLCDFTDIYFQKNLFELITNGCTYVTSENQIIKNCQTNSTWLNLCYNSDIFNLLKHKEILNGGSILGSLSSCISTLKEMCNDMGQIISRIGNYQNIDQACLNKVVYFDKRRFNILNKLQIANLAHHSTAKVEYIKNNISVNEIIPYVIHQYDVIKPLEKFLYEQFE